MLGVFFAGAKQQDNRDIHDLLSINKGTFFQIEIPVSSNFELADHFPTFRTDKVFRKKILNDFEFYSWMTDSSWQMEITIPLYTLGEDLSSKLLSNGKIAKFAIDYLDYDHKSVTRTKRNYWGFMPDNVFCLDRSENAVNKPCKMRHIIFEKLNQK